MELVSAPPMIIDFEFDDETLILAFKVWLAGARGALEKEFKYPIGEKNFDVWNKYNVLAAFDLTFWSDLKQIKFTDVFIANTLWPNEEIDIVERYRKVTKPKMNEIFQNWVFMRRYWKQLEMEKALDKFVSKTKKEG